MNLAMGASDLTFGTQLRLILTLGGHYIWLRIWVKLLLVVVDFWSVFVYFSR